jgi:hypothetical protein
MYATDAEILAVMQNFHPNMAAINSARHSLAYGSVIQNLVDFNVDPDDIVADLSYLLRDAEILYYLELASQCREIESVFSNVQEETMGKSSKKYDNSMPMFFFASGSPKPFLRLVPHETFRMQAFSKVTVFIRLRRKRTKGYWAAAGVVEQDTTARGYE